MELPKICPHCNSGYIKFSGLGAEKIESEISRIFPQARIAEFDPEIITQSPDVDIFVATSAILRHPGYSFGLIGVLGVDNSLNRIDFRASEKTSAILAGLLKLTEGKVIIQTRLPRHHSLRALQNKEPDLFYGEELKQRKQLGFPPYRHIIMVKLRGKKEERAAQVSQALFGKLCLDNKDKGIKVLSVNAAQPVKLRGNFYWQVLVSCANVIKANDLIKKSLKDLAHSGIIVTVDVDPL
jgi:primosomal protein N' (replication factor Y)